jgi:glycopeptide antibiotics resistance protein
LYIGKFFLIKPAFLFMSPDESHFRYLLLWVAFGCSIIALVLYASLMSNPPGAVDFPHADKIEHLLAYGVLMGWFCQILGSKKHQLTLGITFCLMGVTLEFFQGWGGQRYFEYADMVANTAGVFLGWWLSRTWCAGLLYRVDQALSRH